MPPKSKLPTRDDLPSNSINPIVAAELKSEVRSRPVPNAKLLRRKKTLTSGFTEAFFGQRAEDVVGSLAEDILLPALKDMISDGIGTAIDMILYGESRRRGKRNRDRGNGSSISYSRFYQDISSGKNERRPVKRGKRFDDIILEDKGEAEDVLESLADELRQYESVSVARLYELVGLEGQHTDENYGWTSVARMSVRHVSRGWLLDLPEPEELDD